MMNPKRPNNFSRKWRQRPAFSPVILPERSDFFLMRCIFLNEIFEQACVGDDGSHSARNCI
jgi:hypothetical protein